MSLMTHPMTMWLRKTLRSTGLTKPLKYFTAGRNYEEAVDKALFDEVRSGDIAWDIGANVGLYSALLAKAIGASGTVYAFEPSQSNIEKLKKNCEQHTNVSAIAIALSSAAGTRKFEQGNDDLGATSRVIDDRDDNVSATEVELMRGDDIVASGLAGSPNIMKIDVEGHELDVIKGLSEVLELPALRTIIVEVHFELLSQGGNPNGPRWIESHLQTKKFNTRWIDSSHLLATRPGEVA